jgi:hypothetical protein
MVLYVDAAFLLCGAILGIPYTYLDYTITAPIGTREVDLFGSELEKCLSENSFTYWLVRGDLQFFMYSDKWRPQHWTTWLLNNSFYVTVIPFLFLFAHMMRSKYRVNFFVGVASAGLGFAAAVEAYYRTEHSLTSGIARNSNCYQTSLQNVIQKHPVETIANQLAFKLNNSLERHLGQNSMIPLFALQGNEFAYNEKLSRKRSQLNELKFKFEVWKKFQGFYCGQHGYWGAMRKINYPLLVTVVDSEDRIVYRNRFFPESCQPP